MQFFTYFLACLALLFVASATPCTAAENADTSPVYLDEPGAIPPPVVVTHRTRKEKYNEESIAIEREVVQLSDDTLINDGKYVEFYRDGQKYTEGTFKMGIYDGSWQFWHPNGQLCKTITFNNGRPDGQWKVVRQDGTLLAEKSYQDGVRHGKWTIYFEDGKQLKVEVNYEEGKPQGLRTNYFTNGGIHQQINYKNGLLHGTMTEWDDAGNKTGEAEFVEGKVQGKPHRFDVPSAVNSKDPLGASKSSPGQVTEEDLESSNESKEAAELKAIEAARETSQ